MTISTIETPTAVVAGSVGANLIREAAAVMVDAHQLAKAVCSTQMVPKHFQGKPDECAAAMLYGASLGFDPMQSVRQIYVVHGQAALYARAMDALVKGAGHQTWTVATSDDSVTVAGRRKGSDHIEESTWTYDRAKKAGYTNNEKYRTDPQAMLYSKALSEVCRKIAPDVLNGVYSVEEMQLERITVEHVPTRGLAGVLSSAPAESSQAATPDSVATPTQGDVDSPAGAEPLLLDVKSDLAKAMFAAINDAGITDAERLPWVSSVIGREVTTSKEMTEDDARAVLRKLDEAAEIEEAEVVS